MSESFECDICGGMVARTAGPGRMREYRPGLDLPVPDDYVLPVCMQCGEIYLSEKVGLELDKLQRPAFCEWQKKKVSDLIDKIRQAAPGIANREIEHMCGITPTYLSHVLHGRKEIGQTLLNYLEALALYPQEVRRRLRMKKETYKQATARLLKALVCVNDWTVSRLDLKVPYAVWHNFKRAWTGPPVRVEFHLRTVHVNGHSLFLDRRDMSVDDLITAVRRHCNVFRSS